MTDSSRRKAPAKTKAVEFAEYMAKAAEDLIKAIDDEDIMNGADGEDHDADDACDAQFKRIECVSSLRNAIYEFRKRV